MNFLIKKWWWIILLLGVVLLVAVNFKLVLYAFVQARGQIAILTDSVPIDQVLNDPAVEENVKEKIRVIGLAKSYAAEIGLKATGNYTSYFDQKGKPILWNVSGCEPFALNPYEWKFPILGSFAYKGFFDLEMARDEELKLQEAGFDTRVRSVSAWSTLGWFKDPILSNMTERSVGDLSELIFHELTHATFFIKDSLEFNENLASFIGEKATVSFLKENFGEASPELEEYLKEEADDDLFRQHILKGKDRLDSLYRSFDDSWTTDQKKHAKNRMIRQITSEVNALTFHDSTFYEIFSEKLPNNAYFMSFRRYYAFQPYLEEIYQETGGDIGHFIKEMDNKIED